MIFRQAGHSLETTAKRLGQTATEFNVFLSKSKSYHRSYPNIPGNFGLGFHRPRGDRPSPPICCARQWRVSRLSRIEWMFRRAERAPARVRSSRRMTVRVSWSGIAAPAATCYPSRHADLRRHPESHCAADRGWMDLPHGSRRGGWPAAAVMAAALVAVWIVWPVLNPSSALWCVPSPGARRTRQRRATRRRLQ